MTRKPPLQLQEVGEQRRHGKLQDQPEAQNRLFAKHCPPANAYRIRYHGQRRKIRNLILMLLGGPTYT